MVGGERVLGFWGWLDVLMDACLEPLRREASVNRVDIAGAIRPSNNYAAPRWSSTLL